MFVELLGSCFLWWLCLLFKAPGLSFPVWCFLHFLALRALVFCFADGSCSYGSSASVIALVYFPQDGSISSVKLLILEAAAILEPAAWCLCIFFWMHISWFFFAMVAVVAVFVIDWSSFSCCVLVCFLAPLCSLFFFFVLVSHDCKRAFSGQFLLFLWGSGLPKINFNPCDLSLSQS